jgi:hypothetical protein
MVMSKQQQIYYLYDMNIFLHSIGVALLDNGGERIVMLAANGINGIKTMQKY